MRSKITENLRYHILLIEDDEIDQMAFRHLVQQQQLPYDYTIAGSLSQAKVILSSEKFDVVIADYSLGDGTAFDVLDIVQGIPVIFATGAGDEEIAVKAMKAGAYDYLIKDIERSYLKTVPVVIENAIRHKNAEDKLQLLSGAIMSTNDSVYITDMDDKIVFVNKAFCKTYGYKEEEVLGRDSNVLWIGKRQTANTRSVFRTQGVGGTWEIGFYHKRKDGSIFPVSLSRSIIKDAKGNKVAVVGTIRDITERILVEEELRKTNLILKQSIHKKCQLGMMVLKALEKILSNENINSDLSKKRGVPAPINTASKIISDFLDVLQIDTNLMNLEIKKVNLRSIISEAIEAVSPLADEKGINLKSVVPDSELLVKADRNRILQVLTALLSNSIDSTNVNGHIQVGVKDIGNEITVEVQNDNINIDSSKKDKIFNSFEWIREQFNQGKEKELSLGLPLAKELVEMNGGRMWIESREKQGNNFCFSLPKQTVKEKMPMVSMFHNSKKESL